MLKPEIEKALNAHLNCEFYSSYLYLAMAAYLERGDLPGMASWLETHAREELTHAIKFYRYVLDRDAEVELAAVDTPPKTWGSPLAAFSDALEHEREITAKINGLVDLALGAQDHPTNNFLQWFVAEQVEEEALVRDIVGRLKLVGEDGRGLYLLDQELASKATSASGEAGGV